MAKSGGSYVVDKPGAEPRLVQRTQKANAQRRPVAVATVAKADKPAAAEKSSTETELSTKPAAQS